MVSGTPLAATHAFAEESAAQLQTQANSLASTVEQKRQEYADAQAAVNDLQAKIQDNEANIQEIQAKLPEERAKAAEAIRVLYKLQQNTPGLLDLLLSSDNFNDFISTLVYIDSVQSRNTDAVSELAQTQTELDNAEATLTAQKQQADEKAATAQQALQETKQALANARAKAEQQAAAEAAERQAALEAAQQALAEAQAKQEAESTSQDADSDAGKAEEDSGSSSSSTAASSGSATFTTNSGNTATVEIPQTVTVDPSAAETNVTSSEQQGWAARIDAYLAGSPLAGHGATFASAAAQYGIDPRLSAAISCVESGKGTYCFRSHNAWGWGSSNWGDWDTAINAHVAGLASGYGDVMAGGYTLSVAMARRYCPPTYLEWYASVASEMEKI